MRREADPADRRRKLLWLTPEGQAVTRKMKSAVGRAQARIVAPLNEQEARQFIGLLDKLVEKDRDARFRNADEVLGFLSRKFYQSEADLR